MRCFYVRCPRCNVLFYIPCNRENCHSLNAISFSGNKKPPQHIDLP
nr:MAG TPA: alpha-aminoadipate carrier protein [Bacteriophage sp.]